MYHAYNTAFYAVPSIQFVVTLYNERADGVGVYCYYNYKCKHKILGIDAFNNVISNLGYFVLGALFLLFVRIKDKYNFEQPMTVGLHRDASLYYALGWFVFLFHPDENRAILLEGIFSGLYHVSFLYFYAQHEVMPK